MITATLKLCQGLLAKSEATYQHICNTVVVCTVLFEQINDDDDIT